MGSISNLLVAEVLNIGLFLNILVSVSVRRWVLVTIIAVASIAFVISCVTMALFMTSKTASDDKLDDHDQRLHALEGRYAEVTTAEPTTIVKIKPVDAFQISTHYFPSYPDGLATHAIDGNLEPDYFKGSCTHTGSESEQNPWLAVYLGKSYHVFMVVVTNRGDESWGDRSKNLRVGVTNVKPEVGQNLDINSYTLCGEKPGLMGKIGIVRCSEGVAGRYVIVQFRTTNYMNICEIEIYGYEE